jgi:hypothetical protein
MQRQPALPQGMKRRTKLPGRTNPNRRIFRLKTLNFSFASDADMVSS